ncbi:pentatricopeptide repeat-containing protein [Striga asiatica]|uniref:Pentatricopeptide repeat-containing protein n=1 Tax=Striga asiatica TaxID=4170 RepID=A0A5A7RH38_STRAF|nr:pentatricopeptide repeat-containing protein [Striga asiatica]
MEGRFVHEYDEDDSPLSGDEESYAPSPKKSKRGGHKRVVTVPIGDGLRSKLGEVYPPPASVVEFTKSLDEVPGVHTSLILGIRELLGCTWRVNVTHAFREANFAVDHLASFAVEGSLGYHFFHDPPHGVRPWLYHDLSGVSYSRNEDSGQLELRWLTGKLTRATTQFFYSSLTHSSYPFSPSHSLSPSSPNPTAPDGSQLERMVHVPKETPLRHRLRDPPYPAGVRRRLCPFPIESQAIPGFHHTRTTFDAIFRIISKAKMMNLMLEFLQNYMKQRYVHKIRHYNILVMGYAVAGKPETALQVYGEMRFLGVDLDELAYHVLLNSFIDHAREIRLRGFQNEFTHSIMMKSFCKQNELERGEEYLRGTGRNTVILPVSLPVSIFR